MLDCKKNLLNCTSNVNFCVQYYQEKREILDNNFNSFDNLETSIRKSSVIQERINLVSTHMYKQFLEYQRSTMNATETFVKITDNMQSTVEYLKQSLLQTISFLKQMKLIQCLFCTYCGIQSALPQDGTTSPRLCTEALKCL